MLMALSGCAAEHLNHNTVEIAAQVDSVYTRQTLNNLSKFVDDMHAIPSQILLNQGQFQTQNSFTPSFTFPIGPQIASTITSTATTLTNATAHTLAGHGAAIQGSIVQQQNYTGGPLNDANALRNQRALYMYAVYGEDQPIKRNYNPPKTIWYNRAFIYDPFFLQEPHCVLCMPPGVAYNPDAPPTRESLKPNKRLKGGWLLWDIISPNQDNLVYLGSYGNHRLYMTGADYADGVLDDFVLFTLSFSNPTVVITPLAKQPPPTVIHIDNFPPREAEPGLQPRTQEQSKKERTRPETFIVPSAPSGPPATNQMNPPSDRQMTVPFPVIPN